MKRIYQALAIVLMLLASGCGPTLKSVGTSVSRGMSGESVIVYKAEPWDIVNALRDAAPRMQPSAAHTNYFADNVSDLEVTLSSSPLSAGTTLSTLEAANAIPIKISVTTLDMDDYVQVTLNPEPSNHKDAREAQADIIARLDAQFSRRSSD